MTQWVPDAQRENHTIRYFRELLPRVPAQARTALDVGCGEGFASRALAARGLHVTAIDTDPGSLVAARAQDTQGISYLDHDVLTADLPLAGFDVVTALAVLHHMPLEAGLQRLGSLVAPGGVLMVVGCAASTLPQDAPREVAAVIADQWRKVHHPHWDHPSPTVWPPPHSYREAREASAALLPGSEFKRRLLWRYTLVWQNA
jgi:2-polyprenyl-3-methyl-5-hydroxy-6-metoxy-1,4-benzoquinol methylase